MKSDRANKLIQEERRERRDGMIIAFLVGVLFGALFVLAVTDLAAVR